MAKKDDLPADMWLHVASDALARYAMDNPLIDIFEVLDPFSDGGGPMICITLKNTALTDPRLASAFVDAANARKRAPAAPQEEPTTP